MKASLDPQQHNKQRAAEHALGFVRSGMVVGLGAGTTASIAIEHLAHLLNEGLLRDVRGVACSRAVELAARALGIPLVSLDDHPHVDLTIDGADEVDPALNLIKGAGGALLREKIVAQASAREIIVVDASKLSRRLGTKRALPVEVVAFGLGAQQRFLEALGARVALRTRGDGSALSTDQGNHIFDCEFGPIAHPDELAARLEARAGIVAHGLFLGLATDVIVAGDGEIRHLTPPAKEAPV